MTDITVRFAESDQDVVAIHGFLCIVAGPTLPGDIDPNASAIEVYRVVKEECALMAMRDGKLVGTLGIIKAKFWWGKDAEFLANRWFFALPEIGAGRLLLQEGLRIAKEAGQELHIYDEALGRLVILNMSARRGGFKSQVIARQDIADNASRSLH